MEKLKLKTGDAIVVIAGNDKGKTGTITRVFPKNRTALVEGLNKVKRHERKRSGTGKGQIVEKSMPIKLSKLAVADPKTKKPSRVGKRFDEKKKAYVRIARKSGTAL